LETLSVYAKLGSGHELYCGLKGALGTNMTSMYLHDVNVHPYARFELNPQKFNM